MDLDRFRCTTRSRVLIAEDQPLVRGLLVRLLRAAGYQTTAAEDADEALAVWARSPERFALLVTDVRMPSRLDGLALGRLVQARRPELPVLYLSGSDDLEDSQDLVDGVNFLRKPFHSTAFWDAVAGLLKTGRPALASAKRQTVLRDDDLSFSPNGPQARTLAS